MKKTTFKNAIAVAILFFCTSSLSAQAPTVTTNASGGNDYNFTVSTPGNLMLALEELKTTISFTADQKDNFIITGTLNVDDVTYFSAKGTGWPVNTWSLNKLDLSGAVISALLDEQFDGTKNIKEIILPNTLAVLPFKTFAGCTSITRGAGVTTIGGNCYSWARWSSLGVFDAKELFPALTTLQNSAFAYNDNGAEFTGITLPSTFTTFGTDVFSQCPRLASIVIYATTPPAVGSFGNRDAQVWNGTEYVTSPAVDITLYVPEASVDAYKAITAYADYFGVGNIKKIGDFTTSVKSRVTDAPQVFSRNGKIVILGSNNPLFVQVYNLSGKMVASENINSESTFTLNKGCYIVKAGVNTVKVQM
jgi:hypothetical protein